MNYGADTGTDRLYDYEAERDGCARDAYEMWCEDNDLDPDDDHTYDYNEWCADLSHMED